MSALDPGHIRRLQREQRRVSALEKLRQELADAKADLLAARQRERQLITQTERLEVALLGADDSELRRAVADIAARDRELRILRKQVAAALATLQVYAHQDERRGVARSIAALTLAQLRQEIPREESYDLPR